MYGNLGQYIRERIQTCHPKGKTYRDAQLGEFVHSVAVEQLPEHELTCGSEPAWERGEGEAVAEQQPPQASGYEAVMLSWGRRLGVVEALLLEKHQALVPACQMSKWFYDTSTGAAQEQSAVVLLWRRYLASWLLALGEHGGDNDLHGSDRLSIIPYVHGKTELYCAQACLT
jgi:hypothetical protein